jgi:hypothetical protein
VKRHSSTGEYRTPVEILEREPGVSPTGAPSGGWRIVETLWVKVEDVNPGRTDEVQADRGSKAIAVLNLTARWFRGWAERLSSTRRLFIDGQTYNIRSVVEGPGHGTERTLQLEALAVLA